MSLRCLFKMSKQRFCSTLLRFSKKLSFRYLQNISTRCIDILTRQLLYVLQMSFDPLCNAEWEGSRFKTKGFLMFSQSYRKRQDFAKFTGKHLCQSLFLNKHAGQEILTQVFSCKLCEIFKNIFLQNTSGGCFRVNFDNIILHSLGCFWYVEFPNWNCSILLELEVSERNENICFDNLTHLGQYSF